MLIAEIKQLVLTSLHEPYAHGEKSKPSCEHARLIGIAVIHMRAELPERDSARGGNVQGIHTVRHGDADGLVAARDRPDLESRTLSAHKHRKALDALELRVIQ